MNRPDVRNALSNAMIVALAEQLAWAELEPEVKCIVLTGAGTAFSSGGDMKSASTDASTHPINGMEHRILVQRAYQRATAGKLFSMLKPTIAALPGAAAGAGFALAVACDMRIMSRSAFMTTAFAKVGFSGDFGGTYFLTNLIGTAKAREMFFLSDRVSADQALQMGLTNWVCEPDALQATTAEIAARLAASPTVALRHMKENLNRALTSNADDCLDLEATHHVHCTLTRDHREAVSAFVEKRTPRFEGR